MAAKPKKPRKKAKAVTVQAYEIECVVCGEWFEARRSDARTCSNKCRTALSRAEAKKSPK